MITDVQFLEWWYMVTVIFSIQLITSYATLTLCLQKLYSQRCWVVRLLFRSLRVVARFFASGCAWPTEPWVGSFVSPEAFRPWRCSRVDRQHWSSSKRYAAAGAESESLPGAVVWCGSVASCFFKQLKHVTTSSMLYHVVIVQFDILPVFSFFNITKSWHQILLFKHVWFMLCNVVFTIVHY